MLGLWDALCRHSDDFMKWKHFSRYWPFVSRIHRSPVNSPHKSQWRGALRVFFDLRPNKRSSKQWWGWSFETPSCPSWRHCNGSRRLGEFIEDGPCSTFVVTVLYVIPCYIQPCYIKCLLFFGFRLWLPWTSPDEKVISSLRWRCEAAIQLQWDRQRQSAILLTAN